MVAPKAVAKVDQNVEGMHDITSTLKEKPKTWAEIINPQLTRKEEQDKKRIEEQKAAEEARRQAEAVIPQQAVVVSTPPPAPIGGSKESWMAAAGISPADYGHVDYIISRESGWNPNAVNKSSGAGGLPQALPYSKTGCAVGDPICQLRWANSYAVNRYGSWAGAHQFWISRHWW